MLNETKLKSEDYSVYVGTYTGGNSEGIYLCQLNRESGELTLVGVAGRAENPSYLAIDARRSRLYAVNELTDFDGRPGGSVSAFVIQPPSGKLVFINRQFSQGGAPCYLTLDRSGRHLLAVNYLGGNVVVLPLDSDGALGEATHNTVHTGSSLHPERQEGPHPHSIVLDAANKHAFVPDLGLDKIMQYRFDPDSGRLAANQQPWTAVNAGSGPRHMVFHPGGEFAYVVNELSSTITAYAYDPDRGTLEAIQTVSTIPELNAGPNIAADLHISPSGRLLLASNRGHDSIACFAVDPESARLSPTALVETQGKTPRGFAIDPAGSFVLVANQDSHVIVSFRVDENQGTIIPTRHLVQVPSPVCLKIVDQDAH